MFDIGSPTDLLICCAIVYLAAIIQMSVGMGFGMVASPLVALVKPEIVPASIMLVGLIVALSGAWRERSNIHFNELKLGIGGRVLGSFCAFLVLIAVVETDAFFVIFGILMLTAVAIAASGVKFPFTGKSLLGLSVLSGLMGTITAVGAPPMAIIYHDRPPSVVRPTLNAFFAGGCILGLISLGISGWVGKEDFIFAAFMLPSMLLGIATSGYFLSIPSKWLSKGLLALSGLASIMLILKGIF